MRLTRLLTALLTTALLATPAHARMYQWVNAQSGRTQMSGKPPAWYRSDRPGPRIFVFESGRLVDDTARAVSLEERAALRSRAFAISAQEAETARLAAEEKQKGDAKRLAKAEGKDGTEKSALDRGFSDTPQVSAEAAPVEESDATIARLKSIINAWEDQQTQEAKRLLEQNAVVPSSSDAAPAP
jgi:hypothetical protein